MKALVFLHELPRLILEGKKNTTWRINDDKNIQEGDELSLHDKNRKEFAKAKVILVKETTFKDLTEEDKKGHEKFSSDEEMYKIYSKYYDMEVNKNTKLKIIKFQCL